MDRTACLTRKTAETNISLLLALDGTGKFTGGTGIGFLDHMMTLFAKHGFFDVTLDAAGDTQVDCHHTVEDVGIVLGGALTRALGDKSGIRRYGSAYVPMDDSLARCVIDLSGRPFLHYQIPFTVPRLGVMDTEMVEEFFRAVSVHAAMNLHIELLHGSNNHHKAEAAFKAFGRALSEAVALDSRVKGALSTKGTLV